MEFEEGKGFFDLLGVMLACALHKGHLGSGIWTKDAREV